ncbi:MAG: hypothetical protein WB716_06880, partial [Candidatus Acidiferrales bacterium]
ISIACTVSPADVPCYAPATVTENPVACSQTTPATITLPGNFAVCAPTVAPSSMLLPELRGRRGPLDPRLPVAGVVLALLALGAAASVMGGSRKRFARLAQAGALLLVLGAGIAACGGGGTSGNPGTPEQTYTVTVTATAADGTTQTVNLTLIVD